VPSLSLLSAIVLTAGLVVAVTRRVRTAIATTGYFLATVLLGSWIKQANQGMAMTLGDIYFFLAHPVENFGLFVTYPSILATGIGMAAGAMAILIVGLRLERPIAVLSGKRMRTLTAVSGLALAGIGFTAPSSQAASAHGDAYLTWLSLTDMQRPTGWIGRLNVFFENRETHAEVPPKRTVKTSFARPSETQPGERPDILMVFEESTFDPTMLAGCRYPECDNAMLHPLPFAAASAEGALITHTTGGGSWLTEFAFYSGFDWRSFGRGGRFAPISLAPRLRHSLPRTLRALGYRTIAIYPSEGEFLGAETAYLHYGFEEFYSARELELPAEWFKVHDRLVFEKALTIAAKPDDPRPVFVLAMTIRNHGPYRNDAKTLPPEFREIASEMSVGLADYLYRMQDSSRDYAEVAQRWLNSERPRIVGWFGDHQPEVAWEFLTKPTDLNLARLGFTPTTDQLKYITRYQFSANRPTAAQRKPGSVLDASYLGAELLAFAGLPLDEDFAAALDMSRRCGGLLLDCSDRELIKDYLSYRVHELGSVK